METTGFQSHEDLFQCGRCKLVFNSLTTFFEHKKQLCTTAVTIECYDLNTVANEYVYPTADPASTCEEHSNILIETAEILPAFEDKSLPDVPVQHDIKIECNEIVGQEKNVFECGEIFDGDKSNEMKDVIEDLNFDFNTQKQKKTRIEFFQCSLCGMCFKTNNHLLRHIPSHKVWPICLLEKPGSVIEEFSCPYCPDNFSNYLGFRKHIKVHSDKKLYRCFQMNCQELFESAELLLKHMEGKHHPQYTCKICLQVFDNLNDIAAHYKLHKTPKRTKSKQKFRCDLCKTWFLRENSLAHHLATSSHEYPCRVCKKNFTSAKALRNHAKSHALTTTLCCEVCNKTFTLKSKLIIHMLVHSTQQFQCTICGVKFKRKDILQRHMRKHGDERLPCQVETCSKTFTRSDKLREHMLVQHGGLQKRV